jgi:hypothetical protein
VVGVPQTLFLTTDFTDSHGFFFYLSGIEGNMWIMNTVEYNSLLQDTISQERKVPFEVYKNMTGSEKMEIVFELSEIFRQKIFADIRKEHPDYTQDMVMQAYLTLITDDEEFVKEAFGGRELQP